MKKYIFIIVISSFFFAGCEEKKNNSDDDQHKADSISKENIILKEEIELLKKNRLDTAQLHVSAEQDTSPVIKSVVGSFIEASLEDCFHLSFKDTGGIIRNFDNVDNIYGMDMFDRSSSLRLKKGILNKKFRLWYANLKGIDCRDADSYSVDTPKIYVDMPTIIKMEEIR